MVTHYQFPKQSASLFCDKKKLAEKPIQQTVNYSKKKICFSHHTGYT